MNNGLHFIKIILLYLILFLPDSILAQIIDDFEDGNLDGWTQNVTGDWTASNVSPITGVYSLKHNLADIAGLSYISHEINGISIQNGQTVWQFNLKNGNWNPSSSNYFGVYLFSDQSDLHSTLNGYVVGIDFDNETNDYLKLWKVTNGNFTTLVQTTYVWPSEATLGIRVTRSSAGEWTVEYDSDGGFDNLVFGGNGTDNTHVSAFYTGAWFEYTSTRAGEFWMDDYSLIGPPDSDPPFIVSIDAVSDNTLTVNFNEVIYEPSAEMLVNYSVNYGLGNPNSAILNPTNNKQVSLTFSQTFIDHVVYTLTVNDVEDLNGNICSNESASFSYFQIEAVSAVAVSSTGLDIIYNKPFDAITGENESNYIVNGGIGYPTTANIDGTDNQLVHLMFSNQFVLNQLYTVTVSNVEDGYGNSIETTDLNFTWYEIQPFDLVFNEIMCDVNPPPEALPVNEYIEIYNNSPFTLNLTNWSLKIGDDSEKLFPNIVLPPGEYAIICDDAAEHEFTPFGITVPILDETQLTTSGKRLLLTNEEGLIIEDLNYTIDWYNDPNKDNGGWSMERIDPLNYCSEDDNWSATVDYTGGTPGRINSVFASNPDYIAPTVLNLEYMSSRHIRVLFSEKVDVLESEDETNYVLNSSINPLSALRNSQNNAVIDLFFAENFNIGINSIQIGNIEDNCSNTMANWEGSFEYQLIYPVDVEVLSENQLRLHFSEKPEFLSAQTVSNYIVNNGIGSPDIAIISNTDSTAVNLLFSSDFTLEQLYTLSIQNIKDMNDNMMNLTEIEFVYYIPKIFDIIINEIMADINPEPVGIPAARYIELYNTSPYKIDLTDWIFISEGQSGHILPYVTLNSNEYLILCETGQETLFSSFGESIPILTSSDITVSGKNLKLKKPDGTIIEELVYSDEWYNDNEKDNGGWSLERIDPTNFCSENENWTASNNLVGGTPGSVNSVYGNLIDLFAPELENVRMVSSKDLTLEFNENISYESGRDTLNFFVDNGIERPVLALTDSVNRRLVHLVFSDQFSDQQLYTLSVEHISDNCNNQMQGFNYDFTYRLIYPAAIFVNDNNNLKLVFSETPELISACNISNYVCDNSIGNPEIAIRGSSDSTEVFLHFASDFPDGQEITIQISNLLDINGNTMKPAEFKFMHYTPKKGDLVINEVLYDPYPDGSDFVEIFNNSDYQIDLSEIRLATTDEFDSIVSPAVLSDEDFYIEPHTYMAFTSSFTGISQFYMCQNEERIIEVVNFPAYPNEIGTVVLFYDTVILDQFTYNDNMHFKLLDDPEGVSLERVNPYKPTIETGNWHSASEYVGFATPAYQNSQYSEGIPINDEHVNINPHIFSPDNDGYDDYARINFKFDSPGCVATVLVFDAKGRIVLQLADNMLLSTEGSFIWDGFYDDNRLAQAGTYLIYFKVFDLNGNVNIYKKTVILAKKR
jgi:hypothetical protein